MRKTVSSIGAVLGSVIEMLDSSELASTSLERDMSNQVDTSCTNKIHEWFEEKFPEYDRGRSYSGGNAVFVYKGDGEEKSVFAFFRDREYVYLFNPERPQIQKRPISWLRELSSQHGFSAFDLSFLNLEYQTNLYKNSIIIIHDERNDAPYESEVISNSLIESGVSVQLARYDTIKSIDGHLFIDGIEVIPDDFLVINLNGKSEEYKKAYKILMKHEYMVRFMTKPSLMMLFDEEEFVFGKKQKQGGEMDVLASYRSKVTNPIESRYIFWILNRKILGVVELGSQSSKVIMNNEVEELIPSDVYENVLNEINRMVKEGVSTGTLAINRFGGVNSLKVGYWTFLSIVGTKGKQEDFSKKIQEYFKKRELIH